MLSQRSLTGKLNTDASPYSIPRGDWAWAENITISQRDGIARPIVGNRLVNYTLPAGTNKVIGKKVDAVRNRLFYFVYNSNGNHSILIYNDAAGTITKLIESKTDSGGVDILKFDANKKIVNIDIINRDDEGDILSWTDGNVSPKECIVDKILSGAYGVLLEEYITAAKRPPLDCPTCQYKDDSTRLVNALRRQLFQFKYRFVYDDFTKSTWSPASKAAIPAGVWANPALDNDPTRNNQIDIVVTTGSKRVTRIEIAGRQAVANGYSDYFLITSLSKSELTISDNSQYTYAFYNDGVYPYIDVRESNLLFDYVPRKANAQGLANGNVKVYGGILEGYNRIPSNLLDITSTVEMVENSSAAYIPPAAFSVRLDYDPQSSISGLVPEWRISILGTPSTGTRIVVYWENPITFANEIFMDYTTIAGDTAISVHDALIVQRPTFAYSESINVADSKLRVRFDSNPAFANATVTGVIVYPATGGATAGGGTAYETTYNWSSRYTHGIVYFDENGVTNGVHIDIDGSTVNTPAYELGTTAAKTPQIVLEIGHRPPSWAKKFQIVRTRNLIKGSFLMYKIVNVDNSDPESWYFRLEELYDKREADPSFVPNYEFLEGDRMRVIINQIGGGQTFPTGDYIVQGVVERGTPAQQFLKVKKPPTGAATFTASMLIEIWRPATSGGSLEDEVYYEFGEVYDVYTDGVTLCHRGNEVDQTAGSVKAKIRLRDGDVYYRKRDDLWIMDANYSDNFVSAVNSNGRPQALDYNQRELFFPTLVRWSLELQAATTINGINRFYFDNLDEYDRKYGAIKAFTMRDRIMRVFQQLKVGSVPVFQQLIQDTAGNAVVAQSEKILNKVQYYTGDFGVGDNPESIASSLLADYFCDPIRGAVCRVSLDGLNNLSEQRDNNDIVVRNFTKRNGNLNIYGEFHQGEENEYIFSAQPATPDTGLYLTLSFDESSNGFETSYTWYPEMMACINTTLISFKDGALWVHDSSLKCNIFGVQYKPYVKLVFNDDPAFKKTFIALTELSGSVWECIDIGTSLGQLSNLVNADFRKNEDGYHAVFLRATNSVGGITGGDALKGNYISIGFSPVLGDTENYFVGASVKFIQSNLNNR